MVRAARERSQHPAQETNPQLRVRESVTFSRDKNFEREAVVDERAIVRDALRRGMGDITYASGAWQSGGALGFRGIPDRRAFTRAGHASSPRLEPSKQSRKFFVGCAKDEIKSSR